MASTLPVVASSAPRVIPDMRPAMAVADLRKAETRDLRREIGNAIDRARAAVGWNLDQFAAALPAPEGKDTRDARQVRRWLDGSERAQFDVLFGADDEDFKAFLVVQLSTLSRRIARRTALTLEMTS